jgi:outer membrane lipoprotein-sorting protein
MRNLKALPVAVVGVCLGLTGCFHTTRTVQKVQAPETFKTASLQDLEKQVSDRAAGLKTLSASVMLTFSSGGGREGEVKTYTAFRGYIFVQKPADLRVILQLPVIQSRAMDMVSDGKTFTMIIPPRNKAIIGTNEVTTPSENKLENLRPPVFLDSLLIRAVDADEFVSLTESTRTLPPQPKQKVVVEEPDYDLTVMKRKDGNVLTAERVIHISRVTMLPYQQDIFDAEGRVVTQAEYENYQDYNGEKFPSKITIRRPVDEYSLQIDVTKLTLNDVLLDDQFIPPKIQAGMTVQRMN